MKKKCINCGIEKELDNFYKHSKMTDGHLNKCITCCKEQASGRTEKLRESPEYVEKERERGRKKYKRLYVGTAKSHPDNNKRWLDRFPEKRCANNVAQKIPMPTGKQSRHHWSYKEEHWKDVIFLTTKEHSKAHRFIVYDQEQSQYRRYDTSELLDTKEKHEEFILSMINTKPD